MKNVYDNANFFNEYQSMREQEINANNLIEIPAMKKLLPPLRGKTILDLGCGCGDMDDYFIKKGAKRVVATDISENMINEAKKKHFSKKINFKVLKMEKISSIDEKFDIVYSSLAFHYIKDFNRLIKNIYNLLNPNGILVFSQESPLVTSPIFIGENFEKRITVNGKTYNLLSDYCNEGERNNYWNDIPVTKYHRTFVTLFKTLLKNNFEILDVFDSYSTDEAIALCSKYARQKDKPYFIFFKVRKKAN